MNPDVTRPGNGKTGNGGTAVPYYVDPSAQHGGSATAKIIVYAVFNCPTRSAICSSANLNGRSYLALLNLRLVYRR